MYKIGIDIEKISRFKNKKSGTPFLKRVFSVRELDYCLSRGKSSEHLAGRFAAKESVKKAMASFTDRSIDYKEVEIINDKSGKPAVLLKNELKNKFNFSISISHTGNIAVAVTIAIKNSTK